MSTSYPRNIHEKKYWTHEIPTRKNFGPTKYASRKIVNPQHTHEKKFRIHETPTRKNLETSKYPGEKFWTHKTPKRKNFGPTKTERHHDTRPKMAQDPRNLAHSFCVNLSGIGAILKLF